MSGVHRPTNCKDILRHRAIGEVIESEKTNYDSIDMLKTFDMKNGILKKGQVDYCAAQE